MTNFCRISNKDNRGLLPPRLSRRRTQPRTTLTAPIMFSQSFTTSWHSTVNSNLVGIIRKSNYIKDLRWGCFKKMSNKYWIGFRTMEKFSYAKMLALDVTWLKLELIKRVMRLSKVLLTTSSETFSASHFAFCYRCGAKHLYQRRKTVGRCRRIGSNWRM